ncbi:hypothetical protein [Dyella sp.]|uniref:hypothetical protein n=1 Tax=Dyella sp. TaxID=1869338 RepID=UPI002D78DF2A|nr:hypothetical protein [Dyella sp.]HET6431303.1 hypothetical protein [Dyella sp.]
MPVRRAAPVVVAPTLPLVTRYCGYLIRCSVDSYTVSLAGDEVVHQPYPQARKKLDSERLGGWMLEQAKAFVDARRAGHV